MKWNRIRTPDVHVPIVYEKLEEAPKLERLWLEEVRWRWRLLLERVRKERAGDEG